MKGEKWLWVKNKSQDIVAWLGILEGITLAIFFAGMLFGFNDRGWATKFLIIESWLLIAVITTWLLANRIATKKGLIWNTSSFDNIAWYMVVVSFIFALVPPMGHQIAPMLIWITPIAHITLGGVWAVSRTLLTFVGE